MKKTRLMKAAEAKLHEPLEKALPPLINELGIKGTATRLGVSIASINYWAIKLGIAYHHIALSPGETIEIKREVKRDAQQ